MSDKCKEEVYKSVSRRFYRCSRNAVSDGFCKQHHPETKKAHRAKADALYTAKRANNPYNIAIKRAEKTEQQRDALLLALKEAYIHVPLDSIECHGDKCREPHCLSCNGEDYVKNAVSKNTELVVKCRQLIADIEQ